MGDVDLAKYRRHVDHLDMPENKKMELLGTLWQIAQNFVDRAFGDDPAQQVHRGLSSPEDAPMPHTADKVQGKDADGFQPVVGWDETQTMENQQPLAGPFRDSSGRGGGRKR
jgi:hypothetical protein